MYRTNVCRFMTLRCCNECTSNMAACAVVGQNVTTVTPCTNMVHRNARLTFQTPVVRLLRQRVDNGQLPAVVTDVTQIGDEVIGDVINRCDEAVHVCLARQLYAELRSVLVPLAALSVATHAYTRTHIKRSFQTSLFVSCFVCLCVLWHSCIYNSLCMLRCLIDCLMVV